MAKFQSLTADRLLFDLASTLGLTRGLSERRRKCRHELPSQLAA